MRDDDGIDRNAWHHKIYRCEMCREEGVPEFKPKRESWLCQRCAYLFRLVPMGDWVDDAICSQTDPEAFFPQHDPADPHNTTPAVAKAICQRCPVMDACGDWAIENNMEFGVWGGMTRGERIEKRRRAA